MERVLQNMQASDRVVGSTTRSIFKAFSVTASPDFFRVASIPRRDWEENAVELAERLSPLLRTEHGTQVLRPVQATILHDLAVYRGAVGIVRVGGGKTLVSLLAAYIMESFRPLLIIPANLKRKTERDIEKYRQHWKIPQFIRIESFEWLAQKNQAEFFSTYRPDLVVIDEAHRCKSTRAVVTRRINDYRDDCIDYEHFPDPPPFLLMSGTLTKDSIKDYWHLLQWVLPQDRVPLPLDFRELISWSLALDARVGDLSRAKAGVLLELCNEEELEVAKTEPLKAARQAYRRRLQQTPGVICTTDTYEASSLSIHEKRVKPPTQIMKYIEKIRKYEAPDGSEIQDGSVVAQRMMEISLGFYQKWDPAPPPKWLQRRSDWFAVCRKIIKHNRNRHYSELQVKTAIASGMYRKHKAALELWQAVEKSFTPNVKAVWVSDFAVNYAIEWAEKNNGIIWVFHPVFAERLSKKSGIPYYHDEGFDSQGNFIEDHPADKPLIASIKSNMIGKNLQRWCTSLMMYVPSSGEWWEQIIGREHREDQEADEVRFDVVITCIEHLRAFWKAKNLDAQYVEDTALKHKLIFADVDMTTMEEIVAKKGALWEETLPTTLQKEEQTTESE